MDIIQAEKIVDYNGTVAALGNFDGLHKAHNAIIKSGVDFAKAHGLKSGVLLFEENSKEITGTKHIEIITPNKMKLRLLQNENIDFVYIRKFTHEFMQISPEDFIRLLVKNLKVRAVCAGYDYSFGYKAQGDVGLLKKLGEKYGFEVLVTDAVKIDGEIVSSTQIRKMIKDGNVEKAAKFLGRSFCIEGNVVRGFRNGTKMGIPTANIGYDKSVVLPCEGVYAGVTYIDGKPFKSVINVGKNPTFNADKLTIESHILNFNENIYDKNIQVSFEKHIRDVIKFGSVDELTSQIRADIKQAEDMNL